MDSSHHEADRRCHYQANASFPDSIYRITRVQNINQAKKAHLTFLHQSLGELSSRMISGTCAKSMQVIGRPALEWGAGISHCQLQCDSDLIVDQKLTFAFNHHRSHLFL